MSANLAGPILGADCESLRSQMKHWNLVHIADQDEAESFERSFQLDRMRLEKQTGGRGESTHVLF